MSHQHIVQAFNTAAFGLDDLPEPEPDADEHLRRHLAGETPLAPYDGSFRLRRYWKKAAELEGYDELLAAWEACSPLEATWLEDPSDPPDPPAIH